MISSLNTNFNVNFNASWYDKFFKSLPNKDLSNTVKYNKIGSKLASPHWNRLTTGTAAISTQPFIDYFNPNVDNDTAKVSAIRTASKICVCTAVGFLVRGLSYKLVEKYAHESSKEGSTLLTPKEILNTSNKELRMAKLKLHKNAFSTITALSIMLFTNFLVDAPLTTFVSNKILTAKGFANIEKEDDNV